MLKTVLCTSLFLFTVLCFSKELRRIETVTAGKTWRKDSFPLVIRLWWEQGSESFLRLDEPPSSNLIHAPGV